MAKMNYVAPQVRICFLSCKDVLTESTWDDLNKMDFGKDDVVIKIFE